MESCHLLDALHQVADGFKKLLDVSVVDDKLIAILRYQRDFALVFRFSRKRVFRSADVPDRSALIATRLKKQ